LSKIRQRAKTGVDLQSHFLPLGFRPPFAIKYEVIPMTDQKLSRCLTPLAISLVVLMLAGTLAGSAPTEAVLHHSGTGSDGAAPYGRVISDAAGNLYGTTYGTTQFGGLPSNGGAVFALKAEGRIWFEGVVFSFKLSSDLLAVGSVLVGKGGTLYGTTIGSGMNAGAIFKIQP
jgi:hypothetical protein